MAKLVLTPETRVSEIAATYPSAMRMMEALKIDFCCGGQRPLAEAAQAAGVPVETAIAVLQTAITQAASEAGAERDWTEAPLDELMTHIVATHHQTLYQELPRLDAMLELVARVHGPNHGDVLSPLLTTFRGLKEELESHLDAEEQAVFPAIRRLLAGESGNGVREEVADLTAEHDLAGEALAKMRQLTNDYAVPEDACNTFLALYDGLQEMERDLHRHVHLENNILFPRVLERL